ncbi:hypothetical protein DP20_3657 [Shigella flexneri]|nr:hypothetical protein DP20_3657 [Shigella flexneri]
MKGQVNHAISHCCYRCNLVVAPDDPLQNERLHRSRPRGACCWINARNAAG